MSPYGCADNLRSLAALTGTAIVARRGMSTLSPATPAAAPGRWVTDRRGVPSLRPWPPIPPLLSVSCTGLRALQGLSTVWPEGLCCASGRGSKEPRNQWRSGASCLWRRRDRAKRRSRSTSERAAESAEARAQAPLRHRRAVLALALGTLGNADAAVESRTGAPEHARHPSALWLSSAGRAPSPSRSSTNPPP
jgi:hypothetical protein